MNKIKAWANQIKQQLFILYFAYKDKRVPWYSKLYTACIVAYAFSPIDLIPDFIPILGYLDDLLIVPLGVFLALKMIPKDVLIDCKNKVEKMDKKKKPRNWLVGSLIILSWCSLTIWAIFQAYNYFR